MEKYIGKKSIMASPMSKSDAERVLNRELSDAKGGEDGYLVEYEDGYRSWSPKETFEAAYKIAETHLDRLLIESEELNERTSKLHAFILSDVFYKLNKESQDLLMQQYHVMFEYSLLLIKRIHLERHRIPLPLPLGEAVDAAINTLRKLS